MDEKTIQYSVAKSATGLVLAAETERGVCSVVLGQDRVMLVEELERQFPGQRLVESAGTGTAAAIARYIDCPDCELDINVDQGGTEFQKKVWEALVKIPRGTTTTYQRLAEQIGHPKAVRAVGTACGANRVAVLVPCHRVINSAGKLSGYRWGLEWKRALLDGEAVGSSKVTGR